MEKNQPAAPRKIVFVLLLLIFPFIFFLLLELTLRVIGSGDDLSLFKKSDNYTGYYEVNRLVGKRYFTKLPATATNNDIFLIEKPDSCYRVFILGGSSAQGFPYQSGVSFGRVLNYRLQDAFPNKLIEVVNLAMVATNSYTQADFINEILKKKPDAILIYGGHNEYYGALGVGSVENGGNVRWMKRINLKLMHLRTYQMLQKIIAKSFKTFSGDLTDNPTATLMQHIVKEKAIEYGSEMYEAGIKQYLDNTEEIIVKAQKKHVQVLIGELVSNLRDIKPFKSMESENYPSADSIYHLAQKFDSIGNYKQANEYYQQAKDLDGIRFRAPESINDAVHKLGEKFNVPVVPVKAAFEASSPNGIIGNQLMLEHLHPNVDGYFLLADAYFNSMKDNGFIEKKWNETLCKSNAYYRSNWGFTMLDSLYADLSIKKLLAGWPFQPDTVINRFRFTYQPVSYIDSMAFMCIKYNNISIFNQHVELAKKYEKLGYFDKAFDEYYSLIKTEPHNSSLYISASDLLIRIERYRDAITLLQSMPNYLSDMNVLEKIGQCYRLQNDWVQAISYFKRALSICKADTEREKILVLLYDAYLNINQEPEVKKVLSDLIKINPAHKSLENQNKVKIILAGERVKPMLDSAMIYARAGKLEQAVSILDRSLKIEETAFAYSMLGSAYFQTNKAISYEYFVKAYRLDSKDANVLNNLVVLSIMRKNFDVAEKYLAELKDVAKDQKQIESLTNLLNNSKEAD